MNGRILYIFAIPAAIAFLLIGAIGFLIWRPLVILGIPAAIAAAWFMHQRSDAVVLKALGTRGLGQAEGQRVLNIVENLSLSTGIDQPDVQIIDTPACNLAAIGVREPTLIVTTGLLHTLDLLEMEGVIAHALARFSNESTFYTTSAVSARPLITAAQVRAAQGWSGAVAGPGVYDIEGVVLTRDPPGLRSALEKISEKSTEVDGGEALQDAWLVPPKTGSSEVGRRIEVLWELS